MTDEKVLTDEEKKAEEKVEKPLIVEVREKSFNDILREQAESRKEKPEEKPDTTDEDKKKEEEKAAKEAQDAKDKVEAEEAEKKKQEEIATKAAQEVVDKQKAEEQAKLDKVKAEEDEKKRQESLKPHFTGKDKDGNVVPLSYEELHREDVRVAKEEALAAIRAEQAEASAKAEQAKKLEDQTKAQQATNQKTIEELLQKEMNRDLKAMYAAGDMPKINDPKDEKELGNLEFKNLFETAQRVNAERVAKGEYPINSLQIIRYGKDENGKPYYKPLEKPAGHDAPVLGSESPLSHEAPDDQYVPARDREKSMTQLIKEEWQRLHKPSNIRGN